MTVPCAKLRFFFFIISFYEDSNLWYHFAFFSKSVGGAFTAITTIIRICEMEKLYFNCNEIIFKN
jgi:hypothetical protein